MSTASAKVTWCFMPKQYSYIKARYMLLSHIKCWNLNPFTSEREKCLDICVCVCVCEGVLVHVCADACMFRTCKRSWGRQEERMWKWDRDHFYIISFKHSFLSCVNLKKEKKIFNALYNYEQ